MHGRYARQYEPPHASLTPTAGGLAFASSYDAEMVAELKSRVPAGSRKWDNAAKVWIVEPAYGALCARLAQTYLGVTVTVPAVTADTSPTVRLLKLEYLGRCKSRDGGEPSAFGWVNGGWNAILSESALRAYFDAEEQKPGDAPTLYAVLGIKAGVNDGDLRSAYRAMARRWHPDVANDPDATEQFKAIQHAYEVLREPMGRKKYDAGLNLQASLKPDPTVSFARSDYRAPLRCGWLLCEGRDVLGRFIASNLIQWEDIVNERGQVMCTSWPMGADKFEVRWA
jgi:hypothetical protein